MMTRWLGCLLLGGLLASVGAWYAQGWGAAVGIAVAWVLLLGLDTWHAQKMLRWLRSQDLPLAPTLGGLWGESTDRMRRWLREIQTQANAQDHRTQAVFTALNASPHGVVMLDAQGHIVWCNQMACNHFGFDAERDRLQSIGNLVREPTFSTYFAKRDWSRDCVLTGHNSTASRPVRLSVQLFPYGDGQLLLLSRDITALEQAEAMRSDFVANVSHEIRTPLTVLAGFVETMQTLQLETHEQQRYLALMAQQAMRMQNVVQGLLTLSRLEGSPLPARDQWNRVESLLRHCQEEAFALSALRHPTQSEPVHTIVFPDLAGVAGWGHVSGAGAELQSALSNLVSNAIRYTPAGGHVTVDWRLQADGSACFEVRDSGPGIDAQHVPRLTERFYRIDRSRSRETGGTGLGLAIVKHVLQRHGAALVIDSTLGKGSVFRIHFPAERVRRAAVALSAQEWDE